jgi:DNA repair protein RadA/Sms
MGFRAALVPAESTRTAGQSRVLDGMRVVDVDHVARALGLLDLRRGSDERGA